MTDYLKLPPGPQAPAVVTAVIEIPSRTRNKYQYDETLRVFRLDRTLLSPVAYPFEYGFLSSTRGGDGDPLDVMVLSSEPTFPGCVLDARPVACLGLRDQAGEDAKILAAVAGDPRFDSITDLSSVPRTTLREIEAFFRSYSALEGKRKTLTGWTGRSGAQRRIRQAADLFQKEARSSVTRGNPRS